MSSIFLDNLAKPCFTGRKVQIGEIISILRKRKGWSQDALATSVRRGKRKKSLSRKHLSEIETGKADPSLRLVRSLLKELGCELEDFISLDGYKTLHHRERELHEKLQVILRSGEPFVTGIIVNINAIYKDAVRVQRKKAKAG